jgi:hypothetical protein
MLKIQIQIKTIKQIVLMWFVLFSLSPCAVKEVLFHSVNTDYSKPLNKSKTTTSTSSCSYSQNENQQNSGAQKSKINKQIEPVYFFDNQHFTLHSTKIHNNYSKRSSGNSPPKYILYKRLKIDIA